MTCFNPCPISSTVDAATASASSAKTSRHLCGNKKRSSANSLFRLRAGLLDALSTLSVGALPVGAVEDGGNAAREDVDGVTQVLYGRNAIFQARH
jgi:hypothetical protein